MWSRAQLKDKAKYSLKMNYWKVILVTFLLSLVVGGAVSAGSTASSGVDSGFDSGFNSGLFSDPGAVDEDFFFDEELNYDDMDDFDNELYSWSDENGESSVFYAGMIGDPAFELDDEMLTGLAIFAGVFVIIFFIIIVFAIVIGFVYSTFIANPFDVGTKRFYLKNLREPAEVKEIGYAFDNSYKNIANIMFFRMLYTFLWSLLLVIPGIVRSYEYQMIPYLLAENPNLSKEEAFAISKQMMQGNKWKAFVLDLSFIGWDILSAFTIGILSIFYVDPYKNLTKAALYEELSLINGRPGMAPQNSYQEYTNPYEQEVPPVPENYTVN